MHRHFQANVFFGHSVPALLMSAIGIAFNINTQASSARFDIWEYQIPRATLVSVEEIERAVYPYLGVGRSIDDVEAARAAVEQVFRTHGYALVLINIPEQNVDKGLVRLEILEGHVERLHV